MQIGEVIKQRKFESSLQKAVINTIFTGNWLMDQSEKVFKQFDITQQQYNVLRILRGKYPNSICVGDVKEVMLDKNPDLTRLCDRLLKKDLIERELNEFNRRQVLIKITQAGLDLLKKTDPIFKKEFSKTNNLSEEEAEALSSLLDKLRG